MSNPSKNSIVFFKDVPEVLTAEEKDCDKITARKAKRDELYREWILWSSEMCKMGIGYPFLLGSLVIKGVDSIVTAIQYSMNHARHKKDLDRSAEKAPLLDSEIKQPSP